MSRTFILGILFLSALSPAADGRYQVLTYNVGLLKVLFKGSVVPGVDSRAAAIPDALAELVANKKIDIVMLQEVWEKAHAEQIIKALNAKGDDFAGYLPTERAFYTSGLLLLVRKTSFEMGEKDRKLVTFPPEIRDGFEKAANKGFVDAVLTPKTEGLPPLQLLGTHMQCVTTKDGVISNEGERKAYVGQAELLGKAMTDIVTTTGNPLLLLGDFNTGPTLAAKEFEFLEKQLDAVNSFLSLDPASKEITWDRDNYLVKHGQFPNDPTALIDHVFLKSGKNGTVTPLKGEIVFKDTHTFKDDKGVAFESPLSDHYGVVVELKLEGK